MGKKKVNDAGLMKRLKGNPYYAVLHAMNFIKGRLPEEVEACLGDDPQACLLYAQAVCDGRLPDHLHNRMVLLGGEFVQEYLDGLKKNPESLGA